VVDAIVGSGHYRVSIAADHGNRWLIPAGPGMSGRKLNLCSGYGADALLTHANELQRMLTEAFEAGKEAAHFERYIQT
jgi:hypothetical protein